MENDIKAIEFGKKQAKEKIINQIQKDKEYLSFQNQKGKMLFRDVVSGTNSLEKLEKWIKENV